MGVIWTVSLLLVFSFSLPAVMSVSDSFMSTNCTATQNCKGYELNRIRESARASLSKISDYGLLWFSSEFEYFRSVGDGLMMEFFEKVKSIISSKFVANFKIFSMDLPACVMNVAKKIPSFCKCFDPERVQRNATADQNHGKNVGEFKKRDPRAPSNRLDHEIFPQSVLFLILGMDICPREDSMNTCSIMETQGIEQYDRDHVDIYNEDRLVPAAIQQNDPIDLIKESDSYTPYNSQNHDQVSADDQENRLWAGNDTSEISLSLSSTEQTVNFEDMNNNGASQGPIIERNPREFWWLIWASLFVVAALVLILLLLRALISPKMFFSEPYSSQTSKNYKLNKPGGDHITKSMENKKSRACYLGEINQMTVESTEYPMFGSFIDYVEIPVSSEGSQSMEVKTIPVRRSLRIRNKSLSPLWPAPTFTSPLHYSEHSTSTSPLSF